MPVVFVDASELARRLDVGVGTVRSWTRMGRLPHVRDGKRRVMYNLNTVLEALRVPRPRNVKPGERKGAAHVAR